MKLMKKLSYLQQKGELWNTNILVISQIDTTDTQNFTHLEILEQKKLQIELIIVIFNLIRINEKECEDRFFARKLWSDSVVGKKYPLTAPNQDLKKVDSCVSSHPSKLFALFFLINLSILGAPCL